MTAANFRRGAVLAAVCDFGWGSLGKLRLVLDQLPTVDIALFGDATINDRVRSVLDERHNLVEALPRPADVALVINDPAAANAIARQGIPVIYVDSLPYLWSLPEELPKPGHVAIYCAQRFPFERLPVSEVLVSAAHDVHWVDPIVPRASRRVGGGGVIVNLGGLHSHLVSDGAQSYLRLVCPPLLSELADQGRTVLAVCGNLPAGFCNEIRTLFPECRFIGPQSPYEFERLLRVADLLVTSPGSTTILQAARLCLPTFLLPPQNLSQILNAHLFIAEDLPVLAWPECVMDLRRVEQLRPAGEDDVISYMYQSIAEAADNFEARRRVSEMLVLGFRAVSRDGQLDPDLGRLGWEGAAQIARKVRQAVLAPLPRPVLSGADA